MNVAKRMEQRMGAAGTGVTLFCAFFGWLVAHEAELRVTSFCISIVVGLLAIGWWTRKHWRGFRKELDDTDPTGE